MGELEFLIAALFVCVAALNALARRLGIPYPILLVVGGLALGVVPTLPDIQLDPDLVLLVFLPPLLYSAAFFADVPALRENARTITASATVLVVATTGIVAVVAHAVTGLNWAMSFALGAIVSPTDPLAATTILRRLGAPRQLVNTIEGESLVNDASALVLFRIAVGAAVGGTFSGADAASEFVLSTLGGISVGLAVGWLIAEVRRRIEDTTTEITISLLTGYAAFIPADQLGASGVLAAVVAGLYIGGQGPQIASADTRLTSRAVWEILTFILNATLFILIGLQLPLIMDAIDGRDTGELAVDALAVCAAVVLSRIVWAFTAPYLARAIDRRPSQRARRVAAGPRFVSAWSGMRGAVSLAAALSLPLTTDAGVPLPDRDLVLFLTFAVILVTLVGQGLTLPAVIRALHVHEDGAEDELEEMHARHCSARAALSRLDEFRDAAWTRDDTVDRVTAVYRLRRSRFAGRNGRADADDDAQARSQAFRRMMGELFAAQRAELLRLRDDGTISSDVMRRVERDLDLEETRVES